MSTAACVINGADIASPRDFYHSLKTQLGAPDWVGNNCDALWDLLTGLIDGPRRIVWSHAAQSAQTLGPDFERILGVLKDAEKEGHIQLEVHQQDVG